MPLKKVNKKLIDDVRTEKLNDLKLTNKNPFEIVKFQTDTLNKSIIVNFAIYYFEQINIYK